MPTDDDFFPGMDLVTWSPETKHVDDIYTIAYEVRLGRQSGALGNQSRFCIRKTPPRSQNPIIPVTDHQLIAKGLIDGSVDRGNPVVTFDEPLEDSQLQARFVLALSKYFAATQVRFAKGQH